MDETLEKIKRIMANLDENGVSFVEMRNSCEKLKTEAEKILKKKSEIENRLRECQKDLKEIDPPASQKTTLRLKKMLEEFREIVVIENDSERLISQLSPLGNDDKGGKDPYFPPENSFHKAFVGLNNFKDKLMSFRNTYKEHATKIIYYNILETKFYDQNKDFSSNLRVYVQRIVTFTWFSTTPSPVSQRVSLRSSPSMVASSFTFCKPTSDIIALLNVPELRSEYDFLAGVFTDTILSSLFSGKIIASVSKSVTSPITYTISAKSSFVPSRLSTSSSSASHPLALLLNTFFDILVTFATVVFANSKECISRFGAVLYPHLSNTISSQLRSNPNFQPTIQTFPSFTCIGEFENKLRDHGFLSPWTSAPTTHSSRSSTTATSAESQHLLQNVVVDEFKKLHENLLKRYAPANVTSVADTCIKGRDGNTLTTEALSLQIQVDDQAKAAAASPSEHEFSSAAAASAQTRTGEASKRPGAGAGTGTDLSSAPVSITIHTLWDRLPLCTISPGVMELKKIVDTLITCARIYTPGSKETVKCILDNLNSFVQLISKSGLVIGNSSSRFMVIGNDLNVLSFLLNRLANEIEKDPLTGSSFSASLCAQFVSDLRDYATSFHDQAHAQYVRLFQVIQKQMRENLQKTDTNIENAITQLRWKVLDTKWVREKGLEQPLVSSSSASTGAAPTPASTVRPTTAGQPILLTGIAMVDLMSNRDLLPSMGMKTAWDDVFPLFQQASRAILEDKKNFEKFLPMNAGTVRVMDVLHLYMCEPLFQQVLFFLFATQTLAKKRLDEVRRLVVEHLGDACFTPSAPDLFDGLSNLCTPLFVLRDVLYLCLKRDLDIVMDNLKKGQLKYLDECYVNTVVCLLFEDDSDRQTTLDDVHTFFQEKKKKSKK